MHLCVCNVIIKHGKYSKLELQYHIQIVYAVCPRSKNSEELEAPTDPGLFQRRVRRRSQDIGLHPQDRPQGRLLRVACMSQGPSWLWLLPSGND